jgi:thioredoxin 1
MLYTLTTKTSVLFLRKQSKPISLVTFTRSMTSLPILTEIQDRKHFAELLQKNPGLIVVKFGAEWCGPCKTIEPLVQSYFEQSPAKVQCVKIDIDECFDVYAYLKSKKIVNGIPAILCYQKENLNYVPDDFVLGANSQEISSFFERCADRVANL